ncbi:MAG: hypothetical protein A4E61_01671 [Syntrophorhabdus sp. PtaB.Bin184]|jgi:hypothetical protein|nr:MAG: hypothetical protein A4E61_01671 [Syntrophorhabdus sp. PtaB.Bin184]
MMIGERKKQFLVDRCGIGFFKAVLESYEDVAIFSVIDGDRGLIELIYPSAFEDDVRGIMADMANYGITFREVSDVQ